MKYYIIMGGEIIDKAYNIEDAREKGATWSKIWNGFVSVCTKNTLKCCYDSGNFIDMRGKISKEKAKLIKEYEAPLEIN